MVDELPLSAEEQQQVAKLFDDVSSAPNPEEKYNVHLFLHRVATSEDTTKVGFISKEELGNMKYPVRSYKSFAHLAEVIIDNPIMNDFFKQESEIMTSTSLSREGFLVKQATTQTKRIADVSTKSSEKKSWFKKKEDTSNELQQ